MPTEDGFLARFPEFTEQATTLRLAILAEAGRRTPEDVWGTLWVDAVYHLTAHLLAVRVIQLGLTVGQANGAIQGSGLDATTYGQEYSRLRDLVPVCGFVVPGY